MNKFHRTNPAFRKTAKDAENYAKRYRYIRTLSGRKRRFPRGQGAYKALNFLTQGNSSDQLKIGIVEAERHGLWEKVSFMFWLYDELDCSCKSENMKYFMDIKGLVENALPKLNVKMLVETEIGPNWGNLKEYKNI